MQYHSIRKQRNAQLFTHELGNFNYQSRSIAHCAKTGKQPQIRRQAMSEENVVRLCAPTLAGIKTGSLFPVRMKTGRLCSWRSASITRCWFPKDSASSRCDSRTRARCCICTAHAIWAGSAGPVGSRDPAARRLCLRQQRAVPDEAHRAAARVRRIPHEIGLFLSYPPEDVKGFIEHHAADFKYAGLWKVYGDEQRARDLFAKYQRCTEIYCQRLHAGSSIAQLAVNAAAKYSTK